MERHSLVWSFFWGCMLGLAALAKGLGVLALAAGAVGSGASLLWTSKWRRKIDYIEDPGEPQHPAAPPVELAEPDRKLMTDLLAAIATLEPQPSLGPRGPTGPVSTGVPLAQLEGATGVRGPALSSALHELEAEGKVTVHSGRAHLTGGAASITGTGIVTPSDPLAQKCIELSRELYAFADRFEGPLSSGIRLLGMGAAYRQEQFDARLIVLISRLSEAGYLDDKGMRSLTEGVSMPADIRSKALTLAVIGHSLLERQGDGTV